jgi:hypothetical protein
MQYIGSFAISMPYLFSIVPCAQTIGTPFAKIETYRRSLPLVGRSPAHIPLLVSARCTHPQLADVFAFATYPRSRPHLLHPSLCLPLPPWALAHGLT